MNNFPLQNQDQEATKNDADPLVEADPKKTFDAEGSLEEVNDEENVCASETSIASDFTVPRKVSLTRGGMISLHSIRHIKDESISESESSINDSQVSVSTETAQSSQHSLPASASTILSANKTPLSQSNNESVASLESVGVSFCFFVLLTRRTNTRFEDSNIRRNVACEWRGKYFDG
jgi:hypothetical protein